MRRILVLITFQLILLTAMFGTAEYAARTWAPLAGLFHLVHSPNRDNCLLRSPTFGMVFAPNCSGFFVTQPPTLFQTNELGLRSPPLRHDGSMRILAMGDSCTFGWQGSESDAYPQQLEQLLNRNARGGHGRSQVINAGVPGTSSYVGMLYLHWLVPAVQPSIVILQYGFNDAFLGGNVRQAIESSRGWYWLRRLTDFLNMHSTFWRWTQERIQARASGPPPPLPPRQTVKEYRDNLTQMISYLRKRDIAVLMIHFDAGPSYNEAALSLAHELDVPLIVYTGPLLDIVHPTSAGNTQLAVQVMKKLETMDVLP